MAELFENGKVRCCWDYTSQKHWFSVVDICAAICEKEYQAARNYWKWLKNKLMLQGSELVSSVKQLQLEAMDGKLRFTDVMDVTDVLQLIQLFPGSRAAAIRLWIAKLISKGASIKSSLEAAIVAAKDLLRRKVGGFMKTITRKRFNISDDEPSNSQENKKS